MPIDPVFPKSARKTQSYLFDYRYQSRIKQCHNRCIDRLWFSSNHWNSIRSIAWGSWDKMEKDPYAQSIQDFIGRYRCWSCHMVSLIPTDNRIFSTTQHIIISEQISKSVINISLMAIVFHMIWGAIFGFIMSSLLRIRIFRIKQHYVDIINIDPKIRLVTLCDESGQIMYSRHRDGVKNLLSKEESKKSLELAMTSWKIRGELAEKIGKGRYVLAQYEKIKRVTMPFGDDLLLYVTTEVDADHSNIYDRIRRLESGLKYSD
jgi:hypothetical protein